MINTEEPLDRFQNHDLLINIYKASDKEMETLQEIIGVGWNSGNPLSDFPEYRGIDCSLYFNRTGVTYVNDNYSYKNIERILIKDFLDYYDRTAEVSDDEIMSMFN